MAGMVDEDWNPENPAEELLRRALLDDSGSAAVSLKVGGLPLSEATCALDEAVVRSRSVTLTPICRSSCWMIGASPASTAKSRWYSKVMVNPFG